MPFISKLGNGGLIFIIIAIILVLNKKTRKIGLTVALSLILGLIFGNLIMKPMFARIRPYDINTNIILLVERLKDYSFPSGHTLAAFEFATSIFLYNKKFGTFALIFAFIMAFSRLYLYVHFPTDVLGGLVLGVIFAFISYKIINFIYSRKVSS